MKRVELIGSPGVGKTTLYKAIINKSKKSSQWVSASDAKKTIAQRLYGEKSEMSSILYKVCVQIPYIDSFLTKSILRSEYEKSVWLKKDEYQQLLYSLLNLQQTKDELAIRSLYRYSWLLTKIQEACLLDYAIETNRVLIDESILQKVWPLMLTSDISDSGIAEIFSKIPHPFAVIALTCDTDVVLERLIKREEKKENWMIGYRAISISELKEKISKIQHMVNTLADAMESRGAYVLRINTNTDFISHANDINAYFSSLSDI